MKKEELLSLFDAYDAGEFSFAEVLLASGLTDIFVYANEVSEGVFEDALERVLEMNEDDEEES